MKIKVWLKGRRVTRNSTVRVMGSETTDVIFCAVGVLLVPKMPILISYIFLQENSDLYSYYSRQTISYPSVMAELDKFGFLFNWTVGWNDVHKTDIICYKWMGIFMLNTLRPRQMDAISQTTFSNAFSWKKMFEFRLKFHWSLFPRVPLTISQQWFRSWPGAGHATSHCLKQCWLVYWRIYASPGLNELKKRIMWSQIWIQQDKCGCWQ